MKCKHSSHCAGLTVRSQNTSTLFSFCKPFMYVKSKENFQNSHANCMSAFSNAKNTIHIENGMFCGAEYALNHEEVYPFHYFSLIFA